MPLWLVMTVYFATSRPFRTSWRPLSNLAIVNVTPERAEVLILARSSSESMMDYIGTMLESCFNMAGMKVEFSGRYGAWQPNFDSQITAQMVEIYKEMFDEEALVQVVHAGLECSLIGEVYPDMDLVSFGPTLRSPHTPDERCHIPSGGQILGVPERTAPPDTGEGINKRNLE